MKEAVELAQTVLSLLLIRNHAQIPDSTVYEEHRSDRLRLPLVKYILKLLCVAVSAPWVKCTGFGVTRWGGGTVLSVAVVEHCPSPALCFCLLAAGFAVCFRWLPWAWRWGRREYSVS